MRRRRHGTLLTLITHQIKVIASCASIPYTNEETMAMIAAVLNYGGHQLIFRLRIWEVRAAGSQLIPLHRQSHELTPKIEVSRNLLHSKAILSTNWRQQIIHDSFEVLRWISI